MTQVQIKRDRDGDRTLPVFRELSERMEEVRRKAYSLFEQRGGEAGRELDDWITAEHEVLGWPAAELKEANGAFEMEVRLPGFAAKEVEVTATPRELVVHATTTRRDEGQDGTIVWSEFGSSDVYRQFGFPADVDATQVTARLENGILHVRAPRTTAAASAPESPAP